MIEKIYKNKYMVTCDNCGTGQECDNWAGVMEFMREEGWRKKLVDGEWKHYCPECREDKKAMICKVKFAHACGKFRESFWPEDIEKQDFVKVEE